MPTTPNGTVYSDRTFTSSKGYTSTMLVPTSIDGTGTPVHTVLFCHGSGTGDRSRTFSDSTMLTPLKNALMDGGYMLIEGHVGGDHWGNQRGVDAYVALVKDSAKLYNPIASLMVYGRSMGGTVACHLATQERRSSPTSRAVFELRRPVPLLVELHKERHRPAQRPGLVLRHHGHNLRGGVPGKDKGL